MFSSSKKLKNFRNFPNMRILKINSLFHCNEFLIIEVVQVNANGCDIRDSDGSGVKASASNAGDQGSIPGLGRSPGEGNGNPLQYSCLKNPMDREAWQATVHRSQRVRQD